MQIAHVLPNMAIGGRERMVAELCRHARKHNIDPTLIFYDPPARGAAEIEHDARVIRLDRRTKDFARSLSQSLAGFDLVHAQGHVPAHYVRQSGYPGQRLATLHIGMENSWRWLWPIRQGLRAMDHLAAVSDPMAKLYARISGRCVETIANGISLDRFRDQRSIAPAANQTFRFVMLSRLHPVKRHVDAIAAMDHMVAAGQDVELTIAGDGPMASRLADMAHSRSYIRLAGAIADPAPFLARHHAFLLCSDHEGMPLSLIEAMAAGLPAIAADVGEVAAMTTSASLLVTPREPAQMAFAMMQLATDRALWNSLSRGALQQVQKFQSEAVADHYASLYCRLLMR